MTCQAWMDVSFEWQAHIYAQTLMNLRYHYAEVCVCWLLSMNNKSTEP